MCNCQLCESVEFETDYTAPVNCNCGFTGKVPGIATGFIDVAESKRPGITTIHGTFWFTCPSCGVEQKADEMELTFGANNDF